MAHLDLPDDVTKIEVADVVVAEALVPHAGNPLLRALGAASDLSDQEPIYAGGAAVIAVGIVMRDLQTVHGGSRILAAHLLATALRGIVKNLIDRPRPKVAADEGYELKAGERRDSDYSSFPSGHTAGAVAVMMAARRVWPGSRHSGTALASAAAVAQVLRSKHYLTDVVVGAAIGFAAEATINALVRRAESV
jgi:membrane-associated phospholipid phosphatase